MTKACVAIAGFLILLTGSGAALAWSAHMAWGYGGTLLLAQFTLLLTAGTALLCLPIGAVLLLTGAFRSAAAAAAVSAGSFACCFVIGATELAACRRSYRTVVASATPLIDAIRTYETATGHPPDTLDALVPTRIDALPSTRVPCHPRFRYSRNADHRWQLEVFVAHSMGPPDTLRYWPDGIYPRELRRPGKPTADAWFTPVQGGWTFIVYND
jgi:hypothetical protein